MAYGVRFHRCDSCDAAREPREQEARGYTDARPFRRVVERTPAHTVEFRICHIHGEIYCIRHVFESIPGLARDKPCRYWRADARYQRSPYFTRLSFSQYTTARFQPTTRLGTRLRMTPRTETLAIPTDRLRRRAFDFFELTKPRIVVMVLITTFVGFYLGISDTGDYVGLFHTLLGTALVAGGTLALNQVMEREADAKMERTKTRPLPDGRLQPLEALMFGALITIGGLVYLVLLVNPLSALVTSAIVISYLLVYTPLKMKTSLCMVVGAVPGALPPVIGWAAIRGTIDLEAWVLFAIMFLWQMPHSLAIGWLYREDYARAGFQLLPVLDPEGKSTGRQVISNCLALLAVGLIPTLIGFTGAIYFFSALALGLMFLWYGVGLARSCSREAARRLLFASLVYLPVLLAIMAFDKTSF